MKDAAPAILPLRAPETVMRLERMGVMMPTRLSFLRTLLRHLCREHAVVRRTHWAMCAEGFGTAVLEVPLCGRVYSLVAISHPLAPEARSDRVIATAWDAAFVLFDGEPTAEDIERIAREAPKQEGGRFGPRDLVLSRANKSVRMWDATVRALRSGAQPDAQMVKDIGYLMRTTAVYGNGKFGIADRHVVADRPGLEGPFAAEMLAVYLIRQFTIELVSHVGGAPLDRNLARHLGIGNATGLGMAPFLVHHPVLLNNWMTARETALARVRALDALSDGEQAHMRDLAHRAAAHLKQWHVSDPDDEADLRRLEGTWVGLLPRFEALDGPAPLDALWQDLQVYGADVQELAVSVMIEPFADLVDGLEDRMSDPFGALTPPLGGTEAVRQSIARDWSWALAADYDDPACCRRFWYVSAAKLEPRLGDRFAEPGAERETPLDIARRVAALAADLPDTDTPVSAFLAAHPEHALAVSRVAHLADYPYGEIRDNLIAEDMRPIDMLRCKLSFFGATKFDPKSDLWTRVTLAQGAPLGDELSPEMDDWFLPVLV